MGIRNVHCAIEASLAERKDKLGNKITWEKIIADGIAANEQPVEIPKVEERDVMPEPTKPTALPEPPPKPKPAEFYYLNLVKPPNVMVREYDVWIPDEKSFFTVPYQNLKIGHKFRVRNDATVLSIDGLKLFEKLEEPVEVQGQLRMKIRGTVIK